MLLLLMLRLLLLLLLLMLLLLRLLLFMFLLYVLTPLALHPQGGERGAQHRSQQQGRRHRRRFVPIHRA